MGLRLHYLQHVPFEGPGRILSWAETAGAAITATRLYRDEPLPATSAFDLLVIMGGPMSTHDTDRHPWLVPEKAFIRHAIDAGKAVLGICLGAQLVAEALGARVYPNERREIGWFAIQRTAPAAGHPIGACLPPRLTVFHWHGDTFDLPAGSLALARSAACRHQGFVFGRRVVGLQFHLETTPETMQALIANGSDDLRPGPYVQTVEDMQKGVEFCTSNHDVLAAILNQLAAASPDTAYRRQ